MKCPCLHCGGNIEFDADAAGQEITCPHCGKGTWIDDPERFTSASPQGATTFKNPFKPQLNEETFFDRYWIALTAVAVVCLMSGIGMAVENKESHFQGFLLGFGGMFVFLALLCAAIFIYFYPSIVAHRAKKQNYDSIFTLNLCLGWTVVGWVVALAWAQMRAPFNE